MAEDGSPTLEPMHPDDARVPYDDKGWGRIFRFYGRAMLTLGLKEPRFQADGVDTLRFLFLSLLMAGLLIGLVLQFIVEEIPGDVNGAIAIGLVSAGLLGLTAARWSESRPLDAGDPASLAKSYRTQFFMGFFLTDAPLLIGFAIALARSELWPYLVVLPFFLVGMAHIAPGVGNLKRKQKALARQGSPFLLARVLAGKAPQA